MSNPLKTHTDNLADGDFLLSASLTNMLEGVHGNGILLLEDTHAGSSIRNAPASLSGAVSRVDAETIRIKGGLAVLDGLVVDFAGGYTSNAPATFDVVFDVSTYFSGPLNSGQSCLFAVYVTTDNTTGVKRIGVERGNIADSGNFPIAPSNFLNEGGSLDVDQTTVLAVVKVIFTSNSTTYDIDVSTIYDVRTFVKPSPIYLSRMSSGALGATVSDSNRIDSHGDLDGMQGGGTENGAFTASNLGALWMSNDGSGDDVLYFSGGQDSGRATHRLGPNKLSTTNTAQNVKFDDANFFYATPSGTVNLTPSGTFPPSHVVTVFNAATGSSNKIVFDPSGLSNGAATVGDVAAGSSAMFVYTGSAWKKILAASSGSASVSGSAGAIQLSDGSNFSDDAQLTFTTASNTLNVGGPIIMAASLFKAPTGVELTPAGSNPGSTGGNTIWKDTGTGTHLKIGSDVILTSSNFASQFGTSGVGIHSLGEQAIASGDFISFSDTNASNVTKKEAIDDVATLFAGTGLTASSAVIGVDANQAGITSIGPAGNLTVNQDLVVTGNLTINGTTTTINSTTLTVDDKLIELAHTPTFTDATCDYNNDPTITMDSTTKLVAGMSVSGTGIPSSATVSSITDATTFELSASTTGGAVTNGTLTFVGEGTDVGIDGGGIMLRSADSDKSITWNNTSDGWTFNQHIFPSTDSNFNLGSSSVRFANGYFDTVHGAGNFTTITGSSTVNIDSGVLKVDSSKVGINQATPLAPLQVNNLGFGEVSGHIADTGTSGSENLGTFTLFNKTQFRSAKLLIEIDGRDISNSNDVFECAEAVITHDGSSGANITTFGVVQSNSSETSQADYNVVIDSNNVNLVITPRVYSVRFDVRVTWQAMVA